MSRVLGALQQNLQMGHIGPLMALKSQCMVHQILISHLLTLPSLYIFDNIYADGLPMVTSATTSRLPALRAAWFSCRSESTGLQPTLLCYSTRSVRYEIGFTGRVTKVHELWRPPLRRRVWARTTSLITWHSLRLRQSLEFRSL